MILSGEIKVNDVVKSTIIKENIIIFDDAWNQGYEYVKENLKDETILRNYIACGSINDAPPYNFNIKKFSREGLEVEVHISIK